MTFILIHSSIFLFYIKFLLDSGEKARVNDKAILPKEIKLKKIRKVSLTQQLIFLKIRIRKRMPSRFLLILKLISN